MQIDLALFHLESCLRGKKSWLVQMTLLKLLSHLLVSGNPCPYIILAKIVSSKLLHIVLFTCKSFGTRCKYRILMFGYHRPSQPQLLLFFLQFLSVKCCHLEILICLLLFLLFVTETRLTRPK